MANKTMHHLVFGGDIYEVVDQYAREHSVTIDTTLTQSGQAADAKKVGDEIGALNGRLVQVESINFSISVDANGNATLTRSDLVVTEEEDY